MDDLEKTLKNLKEQSEKVSQAVLRAELRAEHALKERNEALDTLREEFNMSSLEEAENSLKVLREDLTRKIAEAEKKLGEIV